MTPNTFKPADLQFAHNLVRNLQKNYPAQLGHGYALESITQDDDQTLTVGDNFVVTSEFEEVGIAHRLQQCYRVVAMWEDTDYFSGSYCAEADLGTYRSLGAAILAIAQDCIERDLQNVLDGTEYPETQLEEA